MNYYARACQLKQETVAHRRYLHSHAEVGLDMPEAKEYVMKTLMEYGIEAKECGHGVCAVIGQKGKVLLLRADMDALPMKEQSGEPFACTSGQQAHTCGHDFHAAMLLTAAKMLKENEKELKGTVKLMFQPAEETFEGCDDMIRNGILENPKVDAALAYHVIPGKMPVGYYLYNAAGTMMFSVDGFRIHIQGKGAHGAYPHDSIDPINIAVHIYLALQALIARECDPSKACVLTIGNFHAGTAANIIPDDAVMEGTIRTNDPKSRQLLVTRMKQTAMKTAEVYGGSASIEMLSEVPTLICDPEMTNEVASLMEQMEIPGVIPYSGITASASEDFAKIAEKVPATFMYLSAGTPELSETYAAHHPKVVFNEDVCPIGASCYAHVATEWLRIHSND